MGGALAASRTAILSTSGEISCRLLHVIIHQLYYSESALSHFIHIRLKFDIDQQSSPPDFSTQNFVIFRTRPSPTTVHFLVNTSS